MFQTTKLLDVSDNQTFTVFTIVHIYGIFIQWQWFNKRDIGKKSVANAIHKREKNPTVNVSQGD